jgi:hypothetical protein
MEFTSEAGEVLTVVWRGIHKKILAILLDKNNDKKNNNGTYRHSSQTIIRRSL